MSKAPPPPLIPPARLHAVGLAVGKGWLGKQREHIRVDRGTYGFHEIERKRGTVAPIGMEDAEAESRPRAPQARIASASRSAYR
jgi:hypothetical protein